MPAPISTRSHSAVTPTPAAASSPSPAPTETAPETTSPEQVQNDSMLELAQSGPERRRAPRQLSNERAAPEMEAAREAIEPSVSAALGLLDTELARITGEMTANSAASSTDGGPSALDKFEAMRPDSPSEPESPYSEIPGTFDDLVRGAPELAPSEDSWSMEEALGTAPMVDKHIRTLELRLDDPSLKGPQTQTLLHDLSDPQIELL